MARVSYVESLPLANSPEVFGLHPNAEIDYYSSAAKEMWLQLLELQPQTGNQSTSVNRDELISHVADDVLKALPACFNGEAIRKRYQNEMSPTTVVLLQVSEAKLLPNYGAVLWVTWPSLRS
ncbi:unnamed protein product [Protopolystoma xenopodis]|uniref:Dynein heavy chain C-terminal domain-containing protein n=1 Tax=Protopolystoma xenopodis TaxID=117903 RepID=A0A3S4ZXD9_9PLAT|nr:unnamed protein product [Protopolystoma xenopodis]